MNIIEKANIKSFHEHRVQNFGDLSVKALGWKNITSQQRRFEILAQIGDLNGVTILDLGCGYGDLKPFLDELYSDFTYVGVDQIPAFAKMGSEKYGSLKNTHFIEADFSQLSFDNVDYILASGAFGYKCAKETYYWETIGRMIQSAKKGVAFNMLDDHLFPEHNLLKAHNRAYVTAFCTKLTKNIEIIDGYLKDDFTVFIRK